MTGAGSAIAAYAISVGLLLAYALRLWYQMRKLARRSSMNAPDRAGPATFENGASQKN